jgi:hypothetical protein
MALHDVGTHRNGLGSGLGHVSCRPAIKGLQCRRTAHCCLSCCAARAEDGGEANPSMSPAVSLRPPAPPLLPGFASPPSSAGIDSACTTPKQPRCRGAARVFCGGKHQRLSGREWATGCGAYAVPRSAKLVARARSALRALTRCGCLSAANAVRVASSATGPRDGAPQGTVACKATALHPKPQTVAHPRPMPALKQKLMATGRYVPFADSELLRD